MGIGDFLGRVGDSFSKAPPDAWFSLAQALTSNHSPLVGLSQGLSGFGQQVEAGKKKASLADALQGAMGGMSPQQAQFLKALPPDQAAAILGERLFKDQPSGPFPGQAFEASVANILARGARDPEFQKTPEYQLAKADWVKPQFVMGPNGPQIFQRGFPLQGAPAPQPAPMPRPAPATRPLPPVATDPLAPETKAGGPVAAMEQPLQSTAPTVTALPGGATVTDIGVGSKPTEAQQKAQTFYTRMKGAETVLENPNAQELYMNLPNWTARQGGDLTEWLQGSEAQTYSTAAREWLAAALRYDSGAQITAQDIAQFGPAYIPERGDSPERLAYKKAARARAAQALDNELTSEQRRKVLQNLSDNPSPSLEKKYPAPPPEAIARLKMARDKAAFDEVFGPGAADKYLGGK